MQEEHRKLASAQSSKKPETAAVGSTGKDEERKESALSMQPGSQKDGEAEGDEELRPKRPAIDMQMAFIEFKETSEGITLQDNIRHERDKERLFREQVRELTAKLNLRKKEIDDLKVRIDRKEEEAKIRES